MSVLQTETHGQVLIVRLNRPERLNALNHELRSELARTRTEFRHSERHEVAILTGTGRAFCAGEDMEELLRDGAPGGRRPAIEDPFMAGTLEKPVIAAINGFAMGGGFMLVERTDLRVAVRRGIRGVGGQALAAGRLQSRPRRRAALSDRDGDGAGFPLHCRTVPSGRFPQRLIEPDALLPSALEMAAHLLTLPPASRVNTVHMMRRMRPEHSAAQQQLAAALHEHGAKSDLMKSAPRSPRSARRG